MHARTRVGADWKRTLRSAASLNPAILASTSLVTASLVPVFLASTSLMMPAMSDLSVDAVPAMRSSSAARREE